MTPPSRKNCYGSWGHYPPIGVLSQEYLLFFPRPVLWTGCGCCHGFPSQPHCGQSIHGVLRTKSPKYCSPPPRFWCRYVDDTFVIHNEANKQGFLQHINSVDPAIRFTVEDNKEDGSIPFLDTIVKPEVDCSLSITVYRKPTHTDQYLQWDSHHHLSAKFSVIQTLSHRGSTVCSNPELLQQEKITSRRLSLSANIPSGLWTRWRKDSTGLPDRLMMGAPTMPSLLTMKCKTRCTLSYPTHKVFVKVSKRSVVGMTSKLTSKVAEPSKSYWSPPRTKTQWSTKVVPSTGTNVGT